MASGASFKTWEVSREPRASHVQLDTGGWGGQDTLYRNGGTRMLQQERTEDWSSALGGCSGARWEKGEVREELRFFKISGI